MEVEGCRSTVNGTKIGGRLHSRFQVKLQTRTATWGEIIEQSEESAVINAYPSESLSPGRAQQYAPLRKCRPGPQYSMSSGTHWLAFKWDYLQRP